MEMHELSRFALATLEILAFSFIFIIGASIIILAVLYVIDRTQTKQAIRHNYPVIGRFRYIFEHLGGFFRQYFFAMDREELPFNRAERSWVYRAAKDIDSTVAFGSTRDLYKPGTVIFGNCPFPKLSIDSAEPDEITIGEYCQHPYSTRSIYNISGMSYGAISKPAVLALSNGAREAGCWMNTGEGGLSPYHLEGGADIVFQIGTAKYGVRDHEGNLDIEKLKTVAAHKQVKMFELKLAQGAKPGKGGMLPGVKVTQEIANIRGIPIGTDSISPNRHIDVNSVDELLDMVSTIREATGKPVGFKAVIGTRAWLDDLFKTINERGVKNAPDFITIDSGDGGTGAAPMSLIDNVGLPIKQSLPLLVNKLIQYGLRKRIKVIASGKLITPVDVAWALATGADFITSARGFMFSIGCIQALQCNKNTCPTGITTHDKSLQSGLNPENKAARVRNYVKNMVYEVGVIAHSCGVVEPRQLRREHAYIVSPQGRSIPLNEMYSNDINSQT
tara:strand:- start:27677 stop:29185 length:1509 start_codon:yes stop_codon:yes gene_type:complete